MPPRQCSVTVRVVYSEVDQMAVVHHASYLRYFEQCRTEYLRERGRSYAEVESLGFILPVVEVNIRYRAPARYDELLTITATLTELKRVSVLFTYEVRRTLDLQLIATGHTLLAVCDKAGRPRGMPHEFRQLLQGD